MPEALPPDLLINADDEVRIRQDLALVALGKRRGDLALQVGHLFDVHARRWHEDQEIIIRGRRIAWVGPSGAYEGEVERRIERQDLWAVPGFGEVHKHIESSHLTPEWEAALVMPYGTTWVCEASHEFSNVDGPHNLPFWLTAREAGSPYKIFPLPGSAVPPTAYEWGGGYFGEQEQAQFLRDSLMVAGLDEVMDWPGVWNPENPSYERLWGTIRATFAKRGVVEGHAAGLRGLPEINGFAAAGMASDHEAWTVEEVREKLRRGLFMELRPHSLSDIIKGLLADGLEDWSQFALCTDDRSCTDTMSLGATDHNLRLAIKAGLKPEIAIQMVTINPARHMRLTPWVGSIAPGRFADLVLLDDVQALSIAEVWADGRQVSTGKDFLPEVPKIDWPAWARQTVKIDREIQPEDFAIPAAPGRKTMQAALLRPFHWEDQFLTSELPTKDGFVERDVAQNITKFAIVDRFSGAGRVSKMFWKGTGPRDSEVGLAASLAHDKHNVWVVGSSDAAMAKAVNALREMQGGWALVREGEVVARVHYEIGGLMSCRPAHELDAEMQALYREAAKIEWMWEPTSSPRWSPGFPERLAFATLTCAPWRWVLVAPSPLAPEGFVNVATGETHSIVW